MQAPTRSLSCPALGQDVRRQLYSAEDDRAFFEWIQKELRAVERRLEDGRAVLSHLEGARACPPLPSSYCLFSHAAWRTGAPC
jgi:hypothetical protein